MSIVTVMSRGQIFISIAPTIAYLTAVSMLLHMHLIIAVAVMSCGGKAICVMLCKVFTESRLCDAKHQLQQANT